MAPVMGAISIAAARLLLGLQDGRAIRAVGAKRTTALPGLRELICLTEVPDGIREIHAVMEAGCSLRVPRVNAEWPAIGAALPIRRRQRRFAAKIAHRRELLRR